MWKGFMVYLFGARYEKAVKSGLICLFVFWGLRQAEISVKIAPLWGVAAGLPLCLGQTDRRFALPIGLSLLTLNTPICILLSADPHLEQAVRMLPGQKRSFILPYGLFLFTFNLIGGFIFLLSFEMHRGGGNGRDLVMAVLIAGLGALGSVEMEWHFPLRNWKTKSDLWRHPRKYVVPGSLLLISGLFASWF